MVSVPRRNRKKKNIKRCTLDHFQLTLMIPDNTFISVQYRRDVFKIHFFSGANFGALSNHSHNNSLSRCPPLSSHRTLYLHRLHGALSGWAGAFPSLLPLRGWSVERRWCRSRRGLKEEIAIVEETGK